MKEESKEAGEVLHVAAGHPAMLGSAKCLMEHGWPGFPKGDWAPGFPCKDSPFQNTSLPLLLEVVSPLGVSGRGKAC